MEEEAIDKHFADQASAFRDSMRKVIVEKHDAAVAHLQATWQDVLEKAREELGDRFDPANYPDPTNLPRGCSFAPRCTAPVASCDSARPRLVGDGKHLAACWNPAA